MRPLDPRFAYGPYQPTIYNPVTGFDRRRIMQRAWAHFRQHNSRYPEKLRPITFGEAITEIWRRAREGRALFETIEPSIITEAERAWISKESS